MALAPLGAAYRLPDGLSVEQRVAINLVMQGKNVFITGGAGVGKSFLISTLQKLKPKMCSTATTGLAAVNIGGRTIHSASGLGIGDQDEHELSKLVLAKWVKKKWDAYESVLIDEISMLSPKFFEKLDFLLRGLYVGSKPFGGLQIIVIGDFAQLPPVTKDDPVDAIQFVFQTKAWEKAKFRTVLLSTVFRQSDRLFSGLLNRCRFGQMTDEDMAVLQSRSGVDVSLNGIEPTHLYAVNVQVSEINRQRLDALPGECMVYSAKSRCIENTLDCQKALADLVKSCPAPAEVSLKVGAQVMLLANVDIESKLCNGSRGVVRKFMTEEELAESLKNDDSDASDSSDDDGMLSEPSAKRPRRTVGIANSPRYPVVEFASGVMMLVKPWAWTTRVNKLHTVSYIQIPLNLAWTSTVHKAQGQSLDRVLVDLTRTFAEGQGYVALSRVRTLDGLSITGLDASAFRTNGAVVDFYSRLQLANDDLDA